MIEQQPYCSSEREILDAMRRYGGSFVTCLAQLYELGDVQNREILASAFRHYFVEYDELILAAKKAGKG